MKKILLSFVVTLPTLCFGLLPPLYETVGEFKSLINDERLTHVLQSGEAVMSIIRENDSFVITTNKSVLVVKIIPQATKLMGPAKYTLEFGVPQKTGENDK